MAISLELVNYEASASKEMHIMYAAIFVSGNEATVYTAPTESEILQGLQAWYAQNLTEEEQHFKPDPETATVADISQDYAGGCSGYFIQVEPVMPIYSLLMQQLDLVDQAGLSQDTILRRLHNDGDGDRCPFCLSQAAVVGHSYDSQGTKVSLEASCNHCDQDWLQVYSLSGVEVLS